MRDHRDSFFGPLQAPEPSLACGAGADSDDGWFEQAASDELGADGAVTRAAEAIGAAAFTPDRELAPRAARRGRRPRERATTIAAPRRADKTRRVAALAAAAVVVVLGAAVLINPPAPDSPDSASRRRARVDATKPPATANPTTTPAPRPAAPQTPHGQLAAGPGGEQRARLNGVARQPRRRARRAVRDAERATVSVPAVVSSSPTRRPAHVASRPPAARRPRAPRVTAPTKPSFTPGDLPLAPSAR